MPKVSVIIPCYNHGEYLDEAVESVLAQTFQDSEIIIVDDGSTDQATIDLLEGYNKPKTCVIRTDNRGLASARNNGIKEAKGEYIVPLDADDKIGKEYLKKAVKILDENEDIGIVYCESVHFGIKKEPFRLPEYSFNQMLEANIIFCSSFFRKKNWERVGGFNINLVYGWEDWDFWLSIVELGLKVYRIPEVLFFFTDSKKIPWAVHNLYPVKIGVVWLQRIEENWSSRYIHLLEEKHAFFDVVFPGDKQVVDLPFDPFHWK